MGVFFIIFQFSPCQTNSLPAKMCGALQVQVQEKLSGVARIMEEGKKWSGTVNCIVYTLNFTFYTLHFTMLTLQCTPYTVHFTLYTLNCTL